MIRAGLIVAWVILGAVGCTGAPALPPPSARTGSPITSPSTQPRISPRIDLRADLSEPPARWHLLAFIRFGRSPHELGIVRRGPHASLNLLPRSFAVADDGSLWILDWLKHRVAHYSSDGRFISEVGRILADRFHPHARDMALVGGRLFVLQDDIGHPKAIVLTQGTDGQWDQTRIVSSERPLVIVQLISTPRDLVGYVAGYGDILDDPSAPRGFSRLDAPGSGAVHRLPGAPLADGQFVDVTTRDGPDMSILFTEAGRTFSQPIHVDLIAHGRSAKSIPPIVGPVIEAVSAHQVFMYVQVAPARTGDLHLGGGRWLLRLGTDGSPLLWERLPDPGIGAEQQFRHLAVGPDGTLYLMVAGPDGERIYRR